MKSVRNGQQIKGNVLLLILLMQTNLHINYFTFSGREVIRATAWGGQGHDTLGLKVRYPFRPALFNFQKVLL